LLKASPIMTIATAEASPSLLWHITITTTFIHPSIITRETNLLLCNSLDYKRRNWLLSNETLTYYHNNLQGNFLLCYNILCYGSITCWTGSKKVSLNWVSYKVDLRSRSRDFLRA
jgi:hypothetical protein